MELEDIIGACNSSERVRETFFIVVTKTQGPGDVICGEVVKVHRATEDNIMACYDGWTKTEFEHAHKGVRPDIAGLECSEILHPRSLEPVKAWWKPSSPPFKWEVGRRGAAVLDKDVMPSQVYQGQASDTFQYFSQRLPSDNQQVVEPKAHSETMQLVQRFQSLPGAKKMAESLQNKRDMHSMAMQSLSHTPANRQILSASRGPHIILVFVVFMQRHLVPQQPLLFQQPRHA